MNILANEFRAVATQSEAVLRIVYRTQEARFGNLTATCSEDGHNCAGAAEHDAGQAEAERCEYCDGTGDVHSIDGEWRGICTCPAGDALRTATPSDASQADSKS